MPSRDFRSFDALVRYAARFDAAKDRLMREDAELQAFYDERILRVPAAVWRLARLIAARTKQPCGDDGALSAETGLDEETIRQIRRCRDDLDEYGRRYMRLYGRWPAMDPNLRPD